MATFSRALRSSRLGGSFSFCKDITCVGIFGSLDKHFVLYIDITQHSKGVRSIVLFLPDCC